ncbi:alpha/beta fold hydrolase [Schaalia naturae]|uniref:Alpha/beta fold hydrolase n=1 Tax=Schaalia naturae TaxID=635203 RepID=A0ABW2SPS4_9ACTO
MEFHPEVPRSVLEPPGPWTHRQVSAGGAAFHVADAGPEDPDHAIVLLHDFPLFWRSWRAVIPRLTAQGHRVVAMDQRGFGTSDLQRDEPDLVQLARDVRAVVSAMGIAQFTVVGAGMGGAVAWMLGAAGSVTLRSVVTVASPHPLDRPALRMPTRLSRGRLLEIRMDVPLRRVRLLESGRLVDGLIRAWAAPANRDRLLAQAGPYRTAMTRPFAASATTDSFSATRHLNKASRRALAPAVRVPVLSVQCAQDGGLSPREFAGDAARACGGFSQAVLRDSGHFASEESPEELADLILRHVARVPPRAQ